MTTRYEHIKNLSLEEMAQEMLTQQLIGISTILTVQEYKSKTKQEVLEQISNTLFKTIIEYLETEID